ncbi:MAG TPA: MFS transporter [Verrucomicrobiae bacterium]|nr:MFS transporter [Verrucomicrobiae bacterium]
MNRVITPERPAPPNAIQPRSPGILHAILALMVVSVAINYIDRGSLSTAAPLLKNDLAIAPSQLGLLLSAFFWTYALLQIGSGWLVDRYEVKWVMAFGFCLWSAATAATGLAQSFGALFALRLLLGVGESVAYPCYSKILAAHFSEQQRGLANGLIDAGTKVGPALGMLAGGMLMARYGWRPVFIVLGLGSLLWVPAWFKWMPEDHAASRPASSAGLGFAEILSHRLAWATFAGHFCGNYFWYFLLTWLPYYLVSERGFSMDQMAVITAVAYCVTALATSSAGWLADRLISSGASPIRVRSACTTIGLALATLVVGVGLVRSSTAAISLLMISCFCYGIFASSHWALTQTIAGPASVGRWSGLQNCLANMAGVAAPAITGLVVQKTGHFLWAFAVSAGVVLIGASLYACILQAKPVAR